VIFIDGYVQDWINKKKEYKMNLFNRKPNDDSNEDLDSMAPITHVNDKEREETASLKELEDMGRFIPYNPPKDRYENN